MSSIRSVCVYCGSSDGGDPRFGEAAEALGKALAAEGISLVYGGGGHGLMGRLARATLSNGGFVTGIIPNFLVRKEHALTDAQEMLVVENMHERKQAMFERADAFVALPGGLGTLEELVEQLTWAQLGRHKKPILIANLKNFWDPLLALITHMRGLGYVPAPSQRVDYLVADRVEDILPKLREAARAVAEAEKAMAVPADRL